ncbi:MAG: hypothetical protein ACRDB1_13515, partial [Microcoleaceae cyanobacterium]
EYLQNHGFVDAIVPRTQLKKTLAQLIRLHRWEKDIDHNKNDNSQIKIPVHLQTNNSNSEFLSIPSNNKAVTNNNDDI